MNNGKLRLVSTDMTGPNGIAFSPDEKYLYVGDWDDHKKAIYALRGERRWHLEEWVIFFDMTSAPGEDAIDGIKVDAKRRPLCLGSREDSGLSPQRASTLGRSSRRCIRTTWPGATTDHQTLYLTAKSGLYKIRLNVKGAGLPK